MRFPTLRLLSSSRASSIVKLSIGRSSSGRGLGDRGTIRISFKDSGTMISREEVIFNKAGCLLRVRYLKRKVTYGA